MSGWSSAHTGASLPAMRKFGLSLALSTTLVFGLSASDVEESAALMEDNRDRMSSTDAILFADPERFDRAATHSQHVSAMADVTGRVFTRYEEAVAWLKESQTTA